MKTIAVLNQKGGVGKTTTVTNVAAALASFGAKVVVIDFDPQAHLTIHLGLEPQSLGSGSYKILTQSAPFESEIMMVRTNLWLLPANIHLVGAESELVSVVGRETILREAIEANKEQFDYSLIDCAPSLGLLTLNALAAAEEVLIPLQPHFLALQGFGKLLETIELVNRRINPSLTVKWILLCMFDSRASLPNEVKADIERFLENARGTNRAWAQAQVIPTFIRRNIKLAEAPSYGKTIFEYEPGCNGAEDYRKVAEFIHAQYYGPVESAAPEEVLTGEMQHSVEGVTPSDNEQDRSEPAEQNARNTQDPSPETQTEPLYIDINQVKPAVESDSFGQSDSQMSQDVPEPSETSPEMENQPADTSEHREQPPIEIREIPPQETQAPAEFSEAPTDPAPEKPSQSESDRQQF
jgi:chromosome partitioning protein